MERPTPVEVERLTLSVLERMNTYLPAAERFNYGPESTIMGDGGALDSLGLANFIVAMEEAFEQEYNTSLSLSDQDLTDLFEERSVTVRSFAEHIAERIGA